MQLTVGRIGRAQGVRGEVSVEVRTDDPEGRFAEGQVLQTEPGHIGPLTVGRVRWQGNRLVVRFRNVPDRIRAESLAGVLLQVELPDAEGPGEDPDEFYDHQLVGLSVRTVAGEVVGELAEVLHLPSQELLSVRTPDGREVLVPFVSAIVTTVDLAGRVATIDPPAGLLDVNIEDSNSVDDSDGPEAAR